MKEPSSDTTLLKVLENCELAGITFIRGYIQFAFEGSGVSPGLNTYTLPQIRAESKIITHGQYGYCDTLCSLIDKHVISAYEDEEKIVLVFENNAEVTVSLKQEDRECAEAAMLQVMQDGKYGEWTVWQYP